MLNNNQSENLGNAFEVNTNSEDNLSSNSDQISSYYYENIED